MKKAKKVEKSAQIPKATVKSINASIKKAKEMFNSAANVTTEAVEANEKLKLAIVQMKKIRNRIILEDTFIIASSLIMIYACLYGGYILTFVGHFAALKYVLILAMCILFASGLIFFTKRIIQIFKG